MKHPCKFCRNPDTIMTYNQPIDWDACSECVILVIHNRYPELLVRMINSHIIQFPKDILNVGWGIIKKIKSAKLSGFMEARGLLPYE